MQVRVGAVGEGREDGQRVELGIQLFSMERNISGCGHKERNSTGRETEERFQKHAKPICAQAVLLRCFVSCFWTPSKFIV